MSEFAAVWDLDGTLVDTADYHFRSWRGLMLENGKDLTPEQFAPTFGLRNDDALRGHLGFSGNASEIEGLSERKEVLFRDLLQREGVRMQPGARALVQHLHRLGWRQAIASSAPPRNIEVIVEGMGLEGQFAAVVSSEEVQHGKPAPDIVLRALERLDMQPQRAVVLEDAPAGIQAGKAAGCRVIAIEGSFPRESLKAADLIVHSFDEVLWPEERWRDWLGSL